MAAKSLQRVAVGEAAAALLVVVVFVVVVAAAMELVVNPKP